MLYTVGEGEKSEFAAMPASDQDADDSHRPQNPPPGPVVRRIVQLAVEVDLRPNEAHAVERRDPLARQPDPAPARVRPGEPDLGAELLEAPVAGPLREEEVAVDRPVAAERLEARVEDAVEARGGDGRAGAAGARADAAAAARRRLGRRVSDYNDWRFGGPVLVGFDG